MARSHSLPAALACRAKIVLACAAGAPNSAVAERFETTPATVGKWRRRFIKGRISGHHDELRPGKPRSIDDERVAALIAKTLHGKPMPPMGFGYVEGVTHDHKRLGTATLFPALNVLNGAVLTDRKPRHRHQEFLAFLREIDKAVPAELDIHRIVDNCSTHNHARVKAWLAARSRWHLRFIPTYSSWLNLVERFFALITDKAIRRGSFRSAKELVAKIDHFVAHHNQHCKPFVWTATADSTLAKPQRLCARLNATGQHTSRGRPGRL
jgi:putative transposase